MSTPNYIEERILDRCKICATQGPDGSWVWELALLNFRGAVSKSFALPPGLMPEHDITEATLKIGLPSCENALRLENAIRCVASIAADPSDYGLTYEQVQKAREAGAVEVLGLILAGRTYGRAKVTVNYTDLAVLGMDLQIYAKGKTPNPLNIGKAMILAAASAGDSSKPLHIRASGELLARIQADAAAAKVSPALAAKRALEKHYGLAAG